MLSRRSLAALALVPVMPAIGVAAVPRDPIGGVCRNAATWARSRTITRQISAKPNRR